MPSLKKENNILWNWKEISAYLEKDIRTLFRWEKELGLPIHRCDPESSKSKVFAYINELDDWLRNRKNNNAIQKKFLIPPKNFWLYATMSAVTLIFITVVIFFKHSKSLNQDRPYKSIGILPFENVSQSDFDEYITQGIEDELYNRLVLKRFMRIQRLLSFPADDQGDFYNIEIKPDFFLEGKVLKKSQSLNIHYRLLDSKNDEVIIEDSIDSDIVNIPLIMNVICDKIYSSLIPSSYDPTANNNNAYLTDNYEVFDAVLKGRFLLKCVNNEESDPWKIFHKGKYFYNLTTRQGNEVAIELFSRAIDLDDSFAYAYIGLAKCYSNYINLGWDKNKRWIDSAENLLKKAQELMPYLPEYFSTSTRIKLIKFIVFNEDSLDLALECASRGNERYPYHNETNMIMGYCYYLKFGRSGNQSDILKALEYSERGFWSSPQRVSNIVYPELLLINQENDKALEICKIMIPSDSSMIAKFKLGKIYYFMGRLNESKSIFEQFKTPVEKRVAAQFYLGMIAARENDYERANKIAKELLTLSPELYGNYLLLSSIYYGMGNEEQGWHYLKKFFSGSAEQEMKFIYLRLIDLDENFKGVLDLYKLNKLLMRGVES